MKSFLKNVLAFTLGTLLYQFLTFFIVGIVIFIIYQANQSPKIIHIKPHSVVKLHINQPITDRKKSWDFSDILPLIMSDSFSSKKSFALSDYVTHIDQLAKDDKIMGMELVLGNEFTVSMASLEVLHRSLTDFQQQGKFILFYHGSTMLSSGKYYLASLADEIILSPNSVFNFQGFSVASLFYKDFLTKYGIEMNVLRVGEFKGAVEPFLRNNFSEENRLQISAFLNEFHSNYLNTVSRGRCLPYNYLDSLMQNGLVLDAEEILKYSLIDSLMYTSEYEEYRENYIKSRMPEDSEAHMVAFGNYVDVQNVTATHNLAGTKNRIAVVVAEGDIVGGEDGKNNIASGDYIKIFQAIRKDKNIKAMVLRINSPGGGAFASDEMWYEIKKVGEKMPVIASMSGVAASGGYYLAMACDSIVAENNTITGSIGVFGIIPSIEKLASEHGISSDIIKTSPFAGTGGMYRSLNEQEENLIQRSVDNIYEKFTTKAAAGRNMPVEELLKVASGRVWTGRQALEVGLVDVIGGLDDALAIAREQVALEEGQYRLRFYPENDPDDWMSELFNIEFAKLSQWLVGINSEQNLEEFVKKQLEAYQGIRAEMLYKVTF